MFVMDVYGVTNKVLFIGMDSNHLDYIWVQDTVRNMNQAAITLMIHDIMVACGEDYYYYHLQK